MPSKHSYAERVVTRANSEAKQAYLEWRIACRKARAARAEMEAEKLESEVKQEHQRLDDELASMED